MKMIVRAVSGTIAAALLAVGAQAADAPKPDAAKPAATVPKPADPHASPPYLAVVNGKVISSSDFDAATREAIRQKFYHGTPPEGEVEQLVRDVANDMIERRLLAEEIKRREMKPDAKAVDEKIAAYEKRYASSARWQQERAQILPALRERLEEDDMLAALEAKTRNVPQPPQDKVLAYYKKHPEKFTEPEKMRISLLLLTVDPSAPTSAWEAAETEAGALQLKLTEGGADFAQLAKEHSRHESAETGGDLGYMHRGMLPEGIQEKIDGMKPGDLSPPTRVLQGIALFRYEALQPPKHHDFETVKSRAGDLLKRDLSDEAWRNLNEQLRKKAKIELNTARYPALAKKGPVATK
ncbi:peptidylprolyl isomerase [Aromatoleum petrolei]|uniref:peptidylprolyl isomerase n=1 Tax=Aromatoleum petrolei TaxID=76116 RepID=A0ABX1MQ35_9RHOO|nr:peptidylprolyl isomerase [Aromatoleum petrolei]NMF88470.1 hypothetical protein [Aromatoleum petrolei]QTQ36954.1 Peptidylprolyl isomerase [Aromatoleum petrolei]